MRSLDCDKQVIDKGREEKKKRDTFGVSKPNHFLEEKRANENKKYYTCVYLQVFTCVLQFYIVLSREI